MQFGLVHSPYSASACSCSLNPRSAATCCWRDSISAVDELLDTPAGQTDQMVVVRALVELEHRAPTFEVIACQQPGMLELRQHPIYRSQADVDVLGAQRLVDVLGAHVPHATLGGAALEYLEHLQPRHGRLEANVLQIGGSGGAVRHRAAARCGCASEYHTASAFESALRHTASDALRIDSSSARSHCSPVASRCTASTRASRAGSPPRSRGRRPSSARTVRTCTRATSSRRKWWTSCASA